MSVTSADNVDNFKEEISNLSNGDDISSNHSLTESSGKGMVLEEGIEEALKKIDISNNLSQERAASGTIRNHRKMVNVTNSRERTIKVNNCTDISSNHSINAVFSKEMINVTDKGVQEIDGLEHLSCEQAERGTSIDQISVVNVAKSEEKRNYIINDNDISIIHSSNEPSSKEIINKEVKGMQEIESFGHLSCDTTA